MLLIQFSFASRVMAVVMFGKKNAQENPPLVPPLRKGGSQMVRLVPGYEDEQDAPPFVKGVGGILGAPPLRAGS